MDLIPADQKVLSQMVADNPSMNITVNGTSEGYQVLFSNIASRVYVLHTQRGDIRHVKSISTLITLLTGIGVQNIVVKNIHLSPLDSYVKNNNKPRKQA